MKKMWDGRFTKATHQSVDLFNSSIYFDYKMYHEDIVASVAHAKHLNKIGILNDEELKQIIAGLEQILTELEEGKINIDFNAEDIHMWVEQQLTNKIGEIGKKLHTGRSRNDQVATDLKLYLRKNISVIQKQILALIKTLNKQASKHLETIMCGYTHMQKAQPITFGHQLLAYIDMLLRDIKRLENTKEMLNYSPLGAGALASSTFNIDSEYTAKLLEFTGPVSNSLDAVSDRDYCISFASDLSLVMLHLSRLSEEIILWTTDEFNYITLDDSYATGSSIMPQKKNPDVAELTRGKSARVIGNLVTLLIMIKGLPLAYNKDLQEDKEAIFDSIETILVTLPAFTGMIDTWTVNTDVMLKSVKESYANATDLAEYLVKINIPFRDAHKIAGKAVLKAIKLGKFLDKMTIEELREIDNRITEEVYEVLDVEKSILQRNGFGGPAPINNKKRVKEIQAVIAKWNQKI
ncbi:argininosuccinate lyase [Mycoplasma buteonis]|uniref:argininosuccinate lyase n=1 Tax=Mycoplasma buteonis TaxID=171280 RepID=UPI00055CAC8F|nr:argininosuccinate lyase [Mycoplasma buteonis]